jgi:type IV pilus assembly protein PilB
MNFNKDKIIEILVSEAYLSKEDVDEAKKAVGDSSEEVLNHLVKLELIDDGVIGQAVAEFFGVGFADIAQIQPTPDVVTLLSEDIARNFKVILFKVTDNTWHLAAIDPNNEELHKAVADFRKGKVKYYFAFEEAINEELQSYKKPLDTRFSKIISSAGRVAPELLDEIIGDAVSFHASDIHFEPNDKNVEIRFRIDGVLQQAGVLDREYYEGVLNRVKILSGLRMDEHFAVQDGSLRLNINNSEVDLRISIAPTLNGEKIVARLLGEYIKSFSLGDLGLLEKDEQVLLQAAKKPFGMILVTGPTGSGKTTTLYSLIKYLANPSINITTIENPVEYRIAGTNQIQVNEDKGITFADGLRSIVRQDPDVVLVGEIRDEETAEISVNAALTGHLLFSTFHANDASTAVPRLLDMGIEPFLLSSTLELVISQRLVRRICPTCRYSITKTAKEIDEIIPGASKIIGKNCSLYVGKGCKSCNFTGYRGRVATYEFIVATPEIRALMLENPSADQIWDVAKKQGARSLIEDGLIKVAAGITTLEEVKRVLSTGR